MSLSQKHSGKVFVPWYNTSEWKQVYDLLCLGSRTNYCKVLEILNIWKYRTPLMSAGIDGTLIILEAILLQNNDLSDTQITQLYGLSLMRFLNICAANNEKQGTFYKTVTKNDLPKWLINIRHDIAHNHKLPSKSLLELGLNCCLEWVKVKYWEVQKDIIFDYVAPENSINPKIVELLNVYIRLKLDLFFHNTVMDYDDSVIDQINYILSKKYTKKKVDINNVVSILEESIKQSLADPLIKKSFGENIAKALVNNNTLLNIQTEITSEDNELEGNEIIPRNFRDVWSNLLNMLYENNFLGFLLDELLKVTNNILLDNNSRNTASLWIREIFQGLQKIAIIKEEIGSRTIDDRQKAVIDRKYPQYKDCLEFDPSHWCLCFTQGFEEQILNLPNKYTLNFLESVLRFNKKSENYISDTVELVNKLTWSTLNVANNEEIYTPDHLEGLFNNGVEMEWTDSDKTVPVDTNVELPVMVQSTNRWTLVKDTLPYQKCPLGILPHQNKIINPVLLI